MMTIDEALSLASNGTKPGTEAIYPLFNVDSTPIWREFLSGMRLALKRCKSGRTGVDEVIEHNLQLLIEVISQANVFKSALRNAEISNPNDHHWYSQPLVKHKDISASLLTVFTGQPIPLHDHPQASGMSLVLGGKIQISRYNLTKKIEAEEGTAGLDKISDRIMGKGEVDSFTLHNGNIHGMRAMTSRCTLVDILIPPGEKHGSRSWFLPTGPKMISASHMYARRVEGEYFLPL